MFRRVSYTLNFDGSHNNQENKAGAGCIIRDHNGELIVAAAYKLVGPDLNVAIAEAVGLRNGLSLAMDRNVVLSVIKGDNQEVIDLVVNGSPPRKQPEPLTSIITEIKRNLGSASLQKIDRADNKVADKLASIGTSLLTESKVFTRHDLPSQIAQLIDQEKDRNGGGGDGDRLGNTLRTVGLVATGAALLWSAFTQGSNLMNLVNSNNDDDNNNNNDDNNNNHYTVQYFGSDRNQLKKARAGCLIKNGTQFIAAAAYNLDNQYPGCNVALAEAIALNNSLKLAINNSVQLNLTQFQGRNKEIRDRVLGLEKARSRFSELIVILQEIKTRVRDQGIEPEELNLKYVDEETIKVARELATIGGELMYQDAVVYDRVEDLPPEVARLFQTWSIS